MSKYKKIKQKNVDYILSTFSCHKMKCTCSIKPLQSRQTYRPSMITKHSSISGICLCLKTFDPSVYLNPEKQGITDIHKITNDGIMVIGAELHFLGM